MMIRTLSGFVIAANRPSVSVAPLPVPPDGLGERLVRAGFVEVAVEENAPWSVRWRASAPDDRVAPARR